MLIDWQAFRLTIELAVVVSAILFVIGLPLAWWIAFSRWRWKFFVEAMVALPIVLPPTVLGFYVLVALGSHSPLGRWWQSLTGHTLAFTFTGLVIGSILYSLPFAVQPFAASFSSVDRKLLAASATLGASPLRTFFRIVVPLSVPGLVTGLVLAFAHTMGVWSGADDRRQHPRRNAHGFDWYLRSSAGLKLCRGQCHGVAAAGLLLRRVDGGLRAEPENAESEIVDRGSGQISECRCPRLRK